MTTNTASSKRVSRLRVPWTRGALGGLVLLVLGAWAGIVAFIGPYLDFGFTPAPGQAWYWTAARGYLEVIPGAAAFVGGLLLLVSTSRLSTSLGGWLAAAAGTWLIIGPPLAGVIGLSIGAPDPAASTGVQALERLFYFFAIGAAILLVSAATVGRLSVLSLRDVRAAERRIGTKRRLAEKRLGEQRLADARHRPDQRRREEHTGTEPPPTGPAGTTDGRA